jgi:hypothetical protein
MLKILKKKLAIAIALVAALSLLLTPAAYAAEGTTQGSFGAASQAPTVDSIEIFSDSGCTVVADSMNPLTPYWCKVQVTSPNKLKHLNEVKATLFYNNSGNPSMVAPGAADTQTCAILTCSIGGPSGYVQTFSILPLGGGTTWVLGSCTAPLNLNVTTGEWIFAFTPGKVATEATGAASPGPDVWDAQGKATNRNSQTDDEYVRGKFMNCYSEITVTGLVDWGDVPLGLTFEDATYNPRPNPDDISITYIANGDYESDIKSTDWTTSDNETVVLDELGGNPPSSAGQFALLASWHEVPSSDNVTVQKNAYTPMYVAGTITPEAGTTFTNNRLWLSLSATGILPGVYSGTIWYQVQCR